MNNALATPRRRAASLREVQPDHVLGTDGIGGDMIEA